MLARVSWRNRSARLGLVVVGVLWLTAFKFNRIENIRRRYGANRTSMCWAILGHVMRNIASIPGRNQQIFLSQIPNPFSSEGHHGRWRSNPRGPMLLFLANTFKHAGMFDLAFAAYQLALKEEYKTDLVLTGLGDLFLVEACWTEEAQAHLAAGILLDESLAPSLRFRTRAWEARSFSDAVKELRKATEINPQNKSAWWLLCCSLLKMKEWDASLLALHEYLALAHPMYEQNLAMAIAEFGRDPVLGLAALKSKLDRWQGWVTASVVQIADSHKARHLDGVKQEELLEEVKLTIKSHVVAGGEISYYEREHTFGRVFNYKIEKAEILPSYGASIAEGNYLLADTNHISPIHWHRYTPSILAVSEENALVCRDASRCVNLKDAIYFGHNKNYYHFICEDLPRLLLLEEKSTHADEAILVDLDIKPWQERLLARLGVNQSRWRAVNFSSPLRLRQLTVPSVVSRDLMAHPRAINLIRERLLPAGGEGKPRPGKRLYLTRGIGSRTARFLNEEKIVRLLSKAGFVSVNTGNMSVDDQIELFSDVEIVAGPAGAAFANLAFAPRECAVLVFAASSDAGEAFSSITSSICQDYFICVGDGYPRPNVSWIHTNFDFAIDPMDVRVALDRILVKGGRAKC
ncbi:TPR repeat-containing protein putative [Rhizobium freirei PRF 81]|uniref:TPR repeat-containing protein putative n=1 Tax=Rhizobium freirei PRF 81 TaxID=363754 RepID=N6UZD0_9HYPH|nr:glycosyltransferase family 61 protein [Rhizobium freirei]ENN84227.1 TPR repeat-containing protein putative [Rhizobium freirei PRF 81]